MSVKTAKPPRQKKISPVSHGFTLCHTILKSKERGGQLAARHKKEGHWLDVSWQEAYSQIETIAAGLLSIGVGRQDAVGLLSNTRLEWWLIDMAIMGINAISVPLYPNSRPEDMAFILNHADCKVLILEDKNQLNKWIQIAHQCPQVQKVICIHSSSDLPDEILSFDDLMDEGETYEESNSEFFTKGCLAAKPEDIATLIYTSGTTGQPKGVVLTHEQIYSEIEDVFLELPIDHSDESLAFLPFSHVAGRIEGWGALTLGFVINFAESIDKMRLNLQEIRPTVIIAVPRIFEKIHAGILNQMELSQSKRKIFSWAMRVGAQASECQQQGRTLPLRLVPQYLLAKTLVFEPILKKLGGRLRFCVSGGAPLSADLARFFHAIGLLILEAYGLSETTGAVTINTPFVYEFGTVGRPLHEVQMKLAEDGEILIKSKKIFKHYQKDPLATAEVFEGEYFKTGDVGEWTEKGCLKITDRKKDLIKTAGGKYVAPQKLENLLKLKRFISQVLIHGDNRKYVVALITLHENEVLDYARSQGISFTDYTDLIKSDELNSLIRAQVAEVNGGLASFESIKNFAILPHDFSVEGGELTASLKIKRRFCEQKYQKFIDALYTESNV